MGLWTVFAPASLRVSGTALRAKFKTSPKLVYTLPEDFAHVASPSFTENVTQAGRYALVDTEKGWHL